MNSLNVSLRIVAFVCVTCLVIFAEPASPICDGIPFLANHDGSFETGVISVCAEGDYGAFAEGFHGPGTVCGVQFYLCYTIWIATDLVYVFVWDSQDGHPGAVLAMQSAHIGYPPACEDYFPSPDEVEIAADVGEEFFVGVSQCSSDFEMWLGVDTTGPGNGDQSWINVPPWPGYSPGWHRVAEYFSLPVHALAIGVYMEPPPTPADPGTWGTIKDLFRR